MSHTITVTRLAGDEWDDAEYTTAGTCDRACEVWFPCEKAWHRHPKNEYGEQFEWSTKRVPHEHQFINGEWSVASGKCALHYAYGLGLDAEAVTEVGTYHLDIEWDGDYWLTDIGEPVVPTAGDNS